MTADPRLRMGIDVGGTNTDAVVLDHDDQLLAKAKRTTTQDVTSGIGAAIDAVLEQMSPAARDRISHVMLGTTHATNAVLERRHLGRLAVVRIGAPSSTAVPPLFNWPDELRSAVSAGETMIRGGIEFDGREIVELDTEALVGFLEPLRGRVDGVAVTSIFAPVSARHEREAEQIIRRVLGSEPHVSLSHEVGTVGLLERENATVLNGALAGVAAEVAKALHTALAGHGITPTVLFTQNDGTLMTSEYALRHPVLTIGAGAANSMRGAAYLTGETDVLVVDVGGTSTDIGMLIGGFPRQSNAAVEIGGIRTNFRMPDLVAIALGGGTVINQRNGEIVVGPNTVGYRLPEEALVFGGATPTLSDAGVAGGRISLGTQPVPAHHGPMLQAGLKTAEAMLADAVDRIKTAKGDLPLVAVGGGSFLVSDDLPGVSQIIRPPHHDVANAIGAAIASVSGEVDRVFHLADSSRQAVFDQAKAEALAHAVRAGAHPDHVEIVEAEEIPLPYLANVAVQIRVKAAGPLGGPEDR